MPTIFDKLRKEKSNTTQEIESLKSLINKQSENISKLAITKNLDKKERFKNHKDINNSILEKDKKNLNFWDYVYIAVSVGCFLGLFLFYFQTVQPIIVYNYTGSAISQIDKLSNSFFDKTSQVLRATTIIEPKLFYNTTATCREDQSFSLERADVDLIINLKTLSLPDQSLREIKKTQNIFYLQEAKDVYTGAYQGYSSQLSQMQPIINEISLYPGYLDFRTSLVKICGIISRSNLTTDQINSACELLKTSSNNYNSKNHPKIWTEAKPFLEKMITNCENFNKTISISRWKIDWFDGFENFMLKIPDFSNDKKILDGLNKDLQASFLNDKKSLDNLYLERKKITNIWYLIKIEF